MNKFITMKKFFAIAVIVLFYMINQQSLFSTTNPKAIIEWKETSIDMGNTPFNKSITVEFIFKNPGMVPLVISKVEPSCGCTVADFPKQPVLSGSEGQISVTFDAKTEGFFSKTISVYSNSEEGLTQLYIKGFVVK
jgi:hypothetical protein